MSFGSFILYGILIIIYCLIFHGFIHYSKNVDASNKYLGFTGLIAVFFILSLVVFKIITDVELLLNGIFMMILLYLPIMIVLSLSFLSSISTRIITRHPRCNITIFKKLEYVLSGKINEMKSSKKDSLRKTNHILMFFGLLMIWLTCLVIILNVTGSSAGMIPVDNNMLLIFLQIIFNLRSINEVSYELGWFYFTIFIFFYSFFIIAISNEFTRKSSRYMLPFNYLSKFVLHEEEIEGYGSYLYFAIAHLFASFFCPPMVFFAILGISTIADLMASQIGMRYGKRSIRWNRKKTWEGNISATVTCFFISFFFVGIVWALLFSFAFSVFDSITGKGYKEKNISDNLLIPIGCALIYLIVRFALGLNYHSIILGLF